MNEVCHAYPTKTQWMTHVTQVPEFYHTMCPVMWPCRATHIPEEKNAWVVSHRVTRRVTDYDWIVSRVPENHAMNESCHTSSWVVSLQMCNVMRMCHFSHICRRRKWIGHVTLCHEMYYTMTEIRDTFPRRTVWMSHVTQVQESHVYMSHGTRCELVTVTHIPKKGMNESCGVATISRLLRIIGLFCKRAL